jgi:hypothetical protein
MAGMLRPGRRKVNDFFYNSATSMAPPRVSTAAHDPARWHIRFGWWQLLAFAALGLGLELLHGFKVGAYLDVSNDTRRLMWRLAHAHGALLGLAHIAYGVSLAALPSMQARMPRKPFAGLVAATTLLPIGFFLGGIRFYAGDPGVGIVLVPAGAVLLLAALFRIARSL